MADPGSLPQGSTQAAGALAPGEIVPEIASEPPGSTETSERAALIETVRSDMAAPLEAYVRNAEAVSPMGTHIVVAHKCGSE